MNNEHKENLLKFAEDYLKIDITKKKYSFLSTSSEKLALFIDLSEDKYDDHLVGFYLENNVLSFEDDKKHILKDITPAWFRFIGKEHLLDDNEDMLP